MKSVPNPRPLRSPTPQPAHMMPIGRPLSAARPMPGLRLRLKPKANSTGHVDGGWWPRSRDLSAELPALVHVLAVRLNQVTEVAYAVEAWDIPPQQLIVDGKPLRLEGFRSQDQYVLHLTGSDGQRLSLLVIPPEVATDRAHDALILASRRGNTDRPVEILADGGLVPDSTVVRLRLASDEPPSDEDTDGAETS